MAGAALRLRYVASKMKMVRAPPCVVVQEGSIQLHGRRLLGPGPGPSVPTNPSRFWLSTSVRSTPPHINMGSLTHSKKVPNEIDRYGFSHPN